MYEKIRKAFEEDKDSSYLLGLNNEYLTSERQTHDRYVKIIFNYSERTTLTTEESNQQMVFCIKNIDTVEAQT